MYYKRQEKKYILFMYMDIFHAIRAIYMYNTTTHKPNQQQQTVVNKETEVETTTAHPLETTLSLTHSIVESDICVNYRENTNFKNIAYQSAKKREALALNDENHPH